MPAKSEKQRQMMGIAAHHPEELYEKNKGVLKMGKSKLREFASKPGNKKKGKFKSKKGSSLLGWKD